MNTPIKDIKNLEDKQILPAIRLTRLKSLVLVLLLGPLSSLSAYAVELIDLGQNIHPMDINNFGTVVGSRQTDQNSPIAFSWTALSGFQDLEGIVANAVNDSEEITGNTLTGAFYYDGNFLFDIGDDFKGQAINAIGQIAGSKSKANPFRATPRPVDPAIYDSSPIAQTWSVLEVANVYSRGRRKGVYADLYIPYDINDAGYMVGKKSRSGLSSSVVFLIMPAFDTVSFLPIPNGGTAAAINNQNNVVGTTGNNSRAGEYSYAFLYDGNTVTNLGTLPSDGLGSEPGLTSFATDINDSDQVVGSSWLVTALTSLALPEKYHAFVWENGLMTDLNDLIQPDNGWVLTQATALNDNGDIVGIGLKNGLKHGFLLSLYSAPVVDPTPTPEPLPPAVDPTPTPTPEPAPPSSPFPAIDNNAEPLEAAGTVTESGANYIVVNDMKIWFDDSATIKFEAGSSNTIVVGNKVEVKAYANIDGSFTAIKLKVKP
jgi:probable HAF family extracellular repeat protein